MSQAGASASLVELVSGYLRSENVEKFKFKIVPPHTAWYSEQAVEEVKRVSATEIARVLSGQRPRFPVNEPKFRER
jgi:phosphoglycerate dehydrogenase-like enzyme